MMIDRNVVENLAKQYEEQPIARMLFRHPRVRSSDRTEMSVDWVLSLLQTGSSPSQRNEVIQLFKKFEDAGAGELFLGRRGKASRFVWNYPLGDLISAVIPSLGSSWAPDSAETRIGFNEPQASAMTRSKLRVQQVVAAIPLRDYQPVKIPHTFQLRRDLVVVLELPDDLTLFEAQRLQAFIGSLPFRLEPG